MWLRLNEICDLAEKYDARVMVDDSHATGFFGPSGKGSLDYKTSWAGWISSPPLLAKPWAGLPADL